MASPQAPATHDEIEEASIHAIKRPNLDALPSSGNASRGASRRGSGKIVTPTGALTPFYTSTEAHEAKPHATKEALMTDVLRKYESMFTLTAQRMRIIVDAFEETLEKGLQENGQIVPMIPAFVFGWPTGKEVGDYLALDLGGTNLRVCLVTLLGGGKFEITQSKYRITEEQKQMDGEKLFDFCAECLSSFIHSSMASGVLKEGQSIPMGFTFSYPCHQDRIDNGILIRWTKGWGSTNVEGHDVAEIFDRSLKKHNVSVKVTAIVNDTTGALIASHYANPRTRVGVILGTGCNAAYMEKVGNIPKMKHLGIPDDELMAINCEWGAFDSFHHQVLPRTKYDIIIDQASNKPDEQSFEKCISGLYLGELLRLVLIELIDEGVLFLGQNTSKLETPYSFETAYLSMMESDLTPELITIVGIFAHFYQLETTLPERQFFKAMAKLIGTRAARLASCGMAALVRKSNVLDEGCSIGIDGSLYNMYPGFKERIHVGLEDILGEKGKNIVTHHAEDGSGLGSAIIAAMTKTRKDAGHFTHL
ncbi:hexokinase A [Tulasnella sp. JGI-2019a]|nr:hexokinase A [Tulasnella sp. JGI-2019a]KAG8993698.1 hexokinase A [Tulasnella sp. JGI-2019a]KAG9021773.1 hexokinase A [Tulasnella sp. JGI-2019a]